MLHHSHYQDTFFFFCLYGQTEFPVVQCMPITESSNMLSWKGPVMVIESNPLHCPRHARSHALCLRALNKHLCFCNMPAGRVKFKALNQHPLGCGIELAGDPGYSSVLSFSLSS